MTDDKNLWDQVKESVTPLGQPRSAGESRYLLTFDSGTIDLHGYTIQGAYERVQRGIARARRDGRLSLTVITGRSGDICTEFPVWANLNPDVRMVETLNGGGAFLLKLRKPQTK